MEQVPPPGASRRAPSTLSPRLTAFIVVDVLLFVGFLVVLALFLSGRLGGADADAEAAATAGTSATAAPSGTASSPAATSADDVAFSLPSGNIACAISADDATCTIASSTATAPVDATCEGTIGLVLTVTADGAEQPCIEGDPPAVAPDGTPVLAYGQSRTIGDFTCTSSSTGVTCRHDPSGAGFKLARAGSELF